MEEQCTKAEEKKPRLNSFDIERPINSWVEPRPATYALVKVCTWEYVELDYFTTRGAEKLRKRAGPLVTTPLPSPNSVAPSPWAH